MEFSLLFHPYGLKEKEKEWDLYALLKSPRFKDFMALAEKSILNSPTAEYNIGDSFNRLAEYKDDALEWLQENPLSKYGGSKLERKKAFEKYLKDTAKNFNLFTNEQEYKPD